jgi:hypothetical protein
MNLVDFNANMHVQPREMEKNAVQKYNDIRFT